MRQRHVERRNQTMVQVESVASQVPTSVSSKSTRGSKSKVKLPENSNLADYGALNLNLPLNNPTFPTEDKAEDKAAVDTLDPFDPLANIETEKPKVAKISKEGVQRINITQSDIDFAENKALQYGKQSKTEFPTVVTDCMKYDFKFKNKKHEKFKMDSKDFNDELFKYRSGAQEKVDDVPLGVNSLLIKGGSGAVAIKNNEGRVKISSLGGLKGAQMRSWNATH